MPVLAQALSQHTGIRQAVTPSSRIGQKLWNEPPLAIDCVVCTFSQTLDAVGAHEITITKFIGLGVQDLAAAETSLSMLGQ
jgi:hypothetical protein